MIATFSESAAEAILNGETTFKNGFRSVDGCFFPEQPSFSPMQTPDNSMNSSLYTTTGYLPQQQSVLKPMIIKNMDIIIFPTTWIVIAVGAYVLFAIVLPSVKRFNDEKLYPYISDSWDEWCNNQNKKENDREEKRTDSFANKEMTSNCTILDFGEHRKRA